MIELTKYDYKENQSAEYIIDLAKSQASLGLGNPNTDALVQDRYTEKQRKIVEFCPQVEDPTKRYTTFIRDVRSQSHRVPPTTVTTLLQQNTRLLKIESNYESLIIEGYKNPRKIFLGVVAALLTGIGGVLYIITDGIQSWISGMIFLFSILSICGSIITIGVLFGTTSESSNYVCNIPLIPKSIQELAKRVKNIDKSAEFYMVFEPKWQEVPTPVLQGDPILVAKVDDKFFMVGYWDGDLDLLKEI